MNVFRYQASAFLIFCSVIAFSEIAATSQFRPISRIHSGHIRGSDVSNLKESKYENRSKNPHFNRLEFIRLLNSLSWVEVEQFWNRISTTNFNEEMSKLQAEKQREASPIPAEKSTTIKSLKQANCVTREVAVKITPPEFANTEYHPKCVPVYRCSGCCNVESLECLPEKTEKMIVQVKYTTWGPDQTALVNVKEEVLDNHLSCKCDCAIKPENCTNTQTYDENDCICKCTNENEKTSCQGMLEKTWNETTCQCEDGLPGMNRMNLP